MFVRMKTTSRVATLIGLVGDKDGHMYDRNAIM